MIKKYFFIYIIIFLVMILVSLINSGILVAKETLVIKIRPFREKNIDYTKEYKYQLLELILSKTEKKYGPFKIEVTEKELIAQSRVMDLIEQGELTLIATMTSIEREQKLLPIRIPVYKNLFGFRIFIINKKDKAKFAKIKTKEELQKLWAGLGHDWPDLKILKSNGFNVVGSSSYRGLFSMLEEGRFDYFPRGLTEPWREVEEEKARNIIVESTLLIHYHAPVYYFVSKQNEELYERIKTGFEMAVKDGSFEKFFNSHWYIKNTLKSAKIEKRKIFFLDNPLLSSDTPIDKKDYWYMPKSFKNK